MQLHKKHIVIIAGGLLLALALLWLQPTVRTSSINTVPAKELPEPSSLTHEPPVPQKLSKKQPTETTQRYFGKGSPSTLAEIPASDLRTKLETLPPEAQQKALQKLANMEFPQNDLTSLRVDSSGGIFYVCSFNSDRKIIDQSRIASAAAPVAEPQTVVTEYTAAGLPILHSNPGSPNVLYLDFDGGVVSGTAWNTDAGAPTEWNCLPYDKDGDAAHFSSSEESVIIETWQRVCEDYAPFNLDITTEEPSVWTRTTLHAMITPTTDRNGNPCPHDGSGGIAYVDIFNAPECAYYSPAWCVDYSYAENVALVISHEIGHNMGLSHDGTSSDEYYSGHNNGGLSWGPIMGAAYYLNLTQWSKGEYYDSNNPQDDLAILASKLSYKPDDHGNGIGTASHLISNDSVHITSSSIIENTDNPDMFAFTTAAGNISITAAPYSAFGDNWGGNSDLELTLYASSGSPIDSNNPENITSSTISTWLQAGTYYVEVKPVGVGNPYASTPTGFTSYGSLGQYTLSGTIIGDRDGDELPDSWESLHFQNITNALATADSDGDGQNNLAEYTAGFDPNDKNDRFTISLQPTQSGNGISWPTLTGRRYDLYRSTNLVSQPFQPLAENLSPAESSYTDITHGSATNGFYRVGVRLSQ